MPSVEGHLYRGDWGPQSGHRRATTFIEATMAGLAQVLLECFGTL
jgi:hypothetical protein